LGENRLGRLNSFGVVAVRLARKMRVARKMMAVSELAWDLENDPRADPPSVKPAPPVDVNAAVEQEMLSEEKREKEEESVVVRRASLVPSPKPSARPTPPRPAPRVRVMAPASSVFEGSLTKRMTTIDQRLLAMARGEIDPEGGGSAGARASDKRPTPPAFAPRPTLVSATEALNRAALPDNIPTKPVPPRFASAAEHQAVELKDESLAPRNSNGIARLDDPFGGLIPVNDQGEAIEVDESWLEDAEEPEPFSSR
jgi:hypothetical protein